MVDERRGRPRDEQIDARVLEVTLEALRRGGYDALRVQAVADAAGVPKSTIYRRWSSLAELAVAAVEHAVGHPDIEATDDPAADLLRIVHAFHDSLIETGLWGFLPRLGLDIVGHPEAAERYRASLIEPLRSAAIDAVRRGLVTGVWSAPPAGAEAADASGAAERIVDMLVGGAIYEAAFLGRPPSVEDTLAAAALVLRPEPRPAP